jgi:hypothetical protein
MTLTFGCRRALRTELNVSTVSQEDEENDSDLFQLSSRYGKVYPFDIIRLNRLNDLWSRYHDYVVESDLGVIVVIGLL